MDSPNGTLWGLVKSLENAFLATATALEPIAWPFVAVIRLFLYACAAVLHKFGNAIVGMTAAFMSAVLLHPDVVDAAAKVMVAGINAFAAQPDLPEKLKAVSQNMTEQDKQKAAEQIGRDLPVLVGGIFHGVFSRGGGNDGNDKSITNGGEEKEGEEKQSDDDKEDGESKNAKSTSGSGKIVVYVNDSGETIAEKTMKQQ